MEHFAYVLKGMISSYEQHVRGRSAPMVDATAQYPRLIVDTENLAHMYAGIVGLDSGKSWDGRNTALKELSGVIPSDNPSWIPFPCSRS